MHTIPFSLKRTFHGFLRVLRPWFRHFTLTPARFDLLYAIQRDGRDRKLQSEIRNILGVCASTVSRMIDSLVDLGFLRREEDRIDRRERIVVLTPLGAATLRRAIEETIPQLAQHIVDCAFVMAWHPYRDDIVPADLTLLERALARAREQLCDTATLRFR
jgi:DNA-binding MarR family transcriptional regulator